MTNEEKVLIVYNRIRDIDMAIMSMDYENKNEQDALIFTDLASGKSALLRVLVDLGENVD